MAYRLEKECRSLERAMAPRPTGTDNPNTSSSEARKSYGVDMLNDIFCPRDRDFILKIPLGLKEERDSWMWHLETRGDYTVKSSYRFLQTYRHNFGRVASPGWRQIWKLSLPAKIKNLLWRAGAELLPTMLVL